MKNNIITAMLVMAGTAHGTVVPRGSSPSQQLCQGTSSKEQGNWYCQKVQRVTYTNTGKSGQYNEVISMDQTTGKCQFGPRQFSGPLAPFNEPVSVLDKL